MYIYTQYKSPLLLKSNIGSLGMIHIYIKSKKEIELDELKQQQTTI